MLKRKRGVEPRRAPTDQGGKADKDVGESESRRPGGLSHDGEGWKGLPLAALVIGASSAPAVLSPGASFVRIRRLFIKPSSAPAVSSPGALFVRIRRLFIKPSSAPAFLSPGTLSVRIRRITTEPSSAPAVSSPGASFVRIRRLL